MAFTYGDAQSLAQDLLDDYTNNMWDANTRLRFANRANQMVFEELFSVCPDLFLSVSQITWPADTGSVDLSGASYLNATVRALKQVIETPSAAAPSGSNPGNPWTAASSYRELVDRYEWSTGLYSGRPVYHLAGQTLHVAPPPTAARYLTVVWHAGPSTLSNTSSVVLNGAAPSVADAVGYCMAYLMNAKQNSQNPAVGELWAQALQKIRAYRNMTGPARIVATRRHG